MSRGGGGGGVAKEVLLITSLVFAVALKLKRHARTGLSRLSKLFLSFPFDAIFFSL